MLLFKLDLSHKVGSDQVWFVWCLDHAAIERLSNTKDIVLVDVPADDLPASLVRLPAVVSGGNGSNCRIGFMLQSEVTVIRPSRYKIDLPVLIAPVTLPIVGDVNSVDLSPDFKLNIVVGNRDDDIRNVLTDYGVRIEKEYRLRIVPGDLSDDPAIPPEERSTLESTRVALNQQWRQRNVPPPSPLDN